MLIKTDYTAGRRIRSFILRNEGTVTAVRDTSHGKIADILWDNGNTCTTSVHNVIWLK